jgi:hypothetical protein
MRWTSVGFMGEGLGEPLIQAFKKKLAEADLYDYVLVDSRTGFSDEAGICTRDLADYLMILSGLNRQNVQGTCEFLKALRVATKGEKQFQIILSPVPNGEDALLDRREAEAKASFESAWGSQIDLELQIPYHPQLALTEEPHIFRRRRGHLFEAYRSIERRMLAALGHDTRTLMQAVEKAIQQKRYSTALHHLKTVIRLDQGKWSLSQLVLKLGEDASGLRRKSGQGTANDYTPTLSEILKAVDGRKVLSFCSTISPLRQRAGRLGHYSGGYLTANSTLAISSTSRYLNPRRTIQMNSAITRCSWRPAGATSRRPMRITGGRWTRTRSTPTSSAITQTSWRTAGVTQTRPTGTTGGRWMRTRRTPATSATTRHF